MANSAVTVSINAYPGGIDNTQHFQQVFGHLKISAGNYPANGMAISWASESIKSNPASATSAAAPAFAPLVYEDSNSANFSGYDYWVDAVGNLHVGSGSNNNAALNPVLEIPSGSNATPTPVVNASIAFIAWFRRG